LSHSKKATNDPSAKPRKEVSLKAWAVILPSVSVVAAAIIAGIFQLLSSHAGSGTAPSSPSASPIASAPATLPNLASAIGELRSPNLEVRKQGAFDLNVVFSLGGPAVQRQIVDILALYIVSHSRRTPIENTYRYCVNSSGYPPYLSEALRIIGERGPGLISHPINLSGISIASANLDNLHLQNVSFNHDLLCGTTWYGANVQGASFQQADLRFTAFGDAMGLTVGQLRTADVLCEITLPEDLAVSKTIQNIIRSDHSFCNVTG
jgi:hypothetical protein